MTRKKNQRITARIAAFALATALVAPQAVVPVASAKTYVPTLSVVQKTVTVGKNFVLKVNKNATSKIVSTDWDVNDAGDERIDLLNEKKKSVKIKAESAGKAVVRAKVKYKVGKAVKTKKLKCTVTVKKAATPTTAPASQAPASQAPATPTPVSVAPVFNAAQTSFDLVFPGAMTCATARDSSDANGSVWTTKAAQVASVNWQGTDTYKLKVTKVTLSSDGTKLSVFTDPGKIRNGARFDVVLTGFYSATGTASTTPVKYPMTTVVSGLALGIDDDLNQPVVDADGHANVIINFNQEVTNAQNYDSVIGATYEKGSWTTNVAKVAKVYQVVNGTASTTPISIQGVHAFNRDASKSTISYLNVDLGIALSNTNTYRIDLTGFAPAGGAAKTLSTIVTFNNEVMIKGNAYYVVQNSTVRKNNQDVNTILYFDVVNGKGRGQIVTATDSSGKATTGELAPTTYATVVDGSNTSCKIAYIQSTRNSSQIEIGLNGYYNNAKFVVKFAKIFPAVFLDLSSTQLMDPGADLTITQNGPVKPTPTPSGGSATYNSTTKAFEITVPVAYDSTIAADESSSSGKVWYSGASSSLFTFYEANSSTGYYNRNNPLSISPDKTTLDSSGRRLILYMNEDYLVNGQRYAIQLNYFYNRATKASVGQNVFLATVNKKTPTTSLYILQGDTMAYAGAVTEAQGDFHTFIRVKFNKAYNNVTSTNLNIGGDYNGGWGGSAANSVCQINGGGIGIVAVRRLSAYNNVVEIEMDGLFSSGSYKLSMKGFYATTDSKSSAADLAFTYTMNSTVLRSTDSDYTWDGNSVYLSMKLVPSVKTDLTEAQVTSYAKKYIEVSGSMQEDVVIDRAYISGDYLVLACHVNGGGDPSVFNVYCADQVPYALCYVGAYVLCRVPSVISIYQESNG